MKSNIKLSFSRLTPVSVLMLLINVISKMTGNANFPTPKVPLEDMQTTADALSNAIEEARGGGLQAKSHRNDLVASAKEDLQAQADYVRSICGGDRTMLVSSGFELAKERTPSGLPAVPENVRVRMTGKNGQVEVKLKKVYGARGYVLRMTDKDPELHNDWTVAGYSTRVTQMVEGLESYKAYWFSVSAIGAAGASAPSTPALGRAA